MQAQPVLINGDQQTAARIDSVKLGVSNEPDSPLHNIVNGYGAFHLKMTAVGVNQSAPQFHTFNCMMHGFKNPFHLKRGNQLCALLKTQSLQFYILPYNATMFLSACLCQRSGPY